MDRLSLPWLIMNRRAGNKGFTLVELVVYLTLASGLSLMVFGFLSSMMGIVGQQSKKSAQALAHALALDMVRKDVMGASMALPDWDSENNVMKKEQLTSRGSATSTWVGWLTKNRALYRLEGSYDNTGKRWINKTTSLLARDVSNFSLLLKYAKNPARVIQVIISFQDQQYVIALRNRVL